MYGCGMNGKKRWQWQQPINAAQALRRGSTIKSFATVALGSMALILSSGAWQLPMKAATPSLAQAATTTAPVPPAIAALMKQLDDAASRKDLDATMKFYSPSFTHTDGLDFKTQQQALKLFWQDAKSIQYQTQINSSQPQDPNRYVLETTTTLRGVRKSADRDMDLTAVVRSRLVIADSKIVSQEILSEQTRLTSGEKPPSVNIALPEQVAVGQTFSFDAIVKEPLGEDLLLGSALEEPISAERYLQPATITLEPLTAGGIFKTAQAPQQPTRKWISAVLIKNGGMTIVSQRLNVVRPNGSTTPTPR
jgi:ketosteroid isomerase-like protein